MYMSQLVGRRIKQRPAEATLESHALLLRGGYIKQVAGGIYSMLPPGLRIAKKIEAIIRDEMETLGGQEVLLPVTQPLELWDESGRSSSIGRELLRFSDRTDRPMVLAMTHEEAVVHLCRGEIDSYKQLPFMVFQIQTKFRDEARSRGGLIRVREFTMKDAYSFHEDQKDLDRFYYRVKDAYHRIFDRAGIPEVVAVDSGSGMMGGDIAHEFMLLSDAGEDTIVTCPECGLLANKELLDIEDGAKCPRCVAPVKLRRGIEVGNIFQLGTKYSETMGLLFRDADGQELPVVMGCYGIGIGRLMASVAEVRSDKNGPKWPLSIAPWQVHLCALGSGSAEVLEKASDLYKKLIDRGIEVLFDDRDERPGVQFAEADLLGVPLRVIVSSRSLEQNAVELRDRSSDKSEILPIKDAVTLISKRI